MNSTRQRADRPGPGAFTVAFGALCLACGVGVEPGPPVILAQPVSRVVGPGQTAVFAVEATSAGGPITYQWSWQGAALSGAGGPTFTSRPAEAADDGTSFEVRVSNGHGSVTSDRATLTVSPIPRPPGRPDLRFQGVDGAPFRIAVYPLVNTIAGNLVSYSGAAGTPLQLAPGQCTWDYMPFVAPPLATQANATYDSGPLGDVEAALAALATPDGVITSLVLDEGASCPGPVYALSRMQLVGAGGGFDVSHLVADPAGAAAAVAQEGAASRVVTAIASRAGQVEFLSYGWAGDRTTVFETTLSSASFGSVGAQAESLAAAGYVVTALGSDGAGGLWLVGTRVQGDRLPRPLLVSTDAVRGGRDLILAGYAIVGLVYDVASSTSTWIGEQ